MPRDAFAELLRIADAQLAAARSVDAQALMALNEERRAVQANLDPVDLGRLDAAERAWLREVALKIRAADQRTRACGRTVLATIAAVSPDGGVQTYGRRGQLRGPG